MTIHEHAERIAERELARKPVAHLPPATRAAVEELAAHLAASLADLLVERAGDDAALSAALGEIYGSELMPHARLVAEPL